jgi:hypothetical protein
MASLSMSKEKLSIQLPMFRAQGKANTLNSAVELLSTMTPEVRMLFSQVELLIRCLLVVPCSNATAERSFSELRRLKIWLRTTMSQERLNHLAVLNVHQNMVDDIVPQDILREFVQMNDFRRNLFGKC